MYKSRLGYLAAFFLLSAVAASLAAEDYVMDPAPQDRPIHRFRRAPGELKKDKFGMIDPSPDVVSLYYLPKDKYGFVDWVKAINEGVIAPRDRILEKDRTETGDEYDKDVLIRTRGAFMPDVLFPHSVHNVWLKCSTCHPKIFKMEAGTNGMSMTAIWKGKFCGRCHDKVAFPTRNCSKCHSVAKARKR